MYIDDGMCDNMSRTADGRSVSSQLSTCRTTHVMMRGSKLRNRAMKRVHVLFRQGLHLLLRDRIAAEGIFIVMDYINETKQRIESKYDEMTAVERSIADYFMKNKKVKDFSSKNISIKLYVSEATLSRFAKKCGYKGYREFIFSYEKDLENEDNAEAERDISAITRKVKQTYGTLMHESFQMLDEEKIRRIAGIMNDVRKVFIYGVGSSGFAAGEFQYRFMRIGLDVAAFTDFQMIPISAALASEDHLIIGISLSGTTDIISEGLKIAKEKGARTVLITADTSSGAVTYADEVIQVAFSKNLDTGTVISPQFSILVMIDVLYSYYFENDSYFKAQKYNQTLSAIKKEGVDNGEKML